MKSRELDQFYTNPKIAKKYFEITKKMIKDLDSKILLEPSAGSGSFSDLFISDYQFLALDLDPKKSYIQKQDFFDFQINDFLEHEIVTIGNPPFGKNSSLAVKFFNKAAEFSEYICFVIPKTFKKDSLINRLNKNMFLIFQEDLDKNSFIFNDKPYDVPCVFQIWKKDIAKERLKIKKKIKSKYFDFVKKEEADFAIRRVGGLAGKIFDSFIEYKEQSHYFIKSNKLLSKEELFNDIKDLFEDLNLIAQNSVGNPSLSKGELIELFEKKQ